MTNREQKIIIRWRTRGQAKALVPALDHAYPIEHDPCFEKMLKAIDEAERQVWGECDHVTDKVD